MGHHNLTIIMYHYVRPLQDSRYPEIKGLELNAFDGQLDYLSTHYQVVQPSEVIEALHAGTPLPESPVLLTFDDGYKDHIQFVFPALQRRGMSGVFFPASAAIRNRELLDVNRVHFLLAAVPDKAMLARRVEQDIEAARSEFDLDSLESYRASLRKPSRFDTANVIYIKRLLQRALPEELRGRIARRMFAEFVSTDEAAFADDLYATVDELKMMMDGGMQIGSHGDRHYWLDSLNEHGQAADIDRSLTFLDDLGVTRRNFWFCYPYGSYNQETLRLLDQRGCGAAVTTVAEVARVSRDRALELPRLDTNDLPTVGDGHDRHN